MITKYYLVSDKEAIWVADWAEQKGLTAFGFLSREDECMSALRAFLERNKGATLKFLPVHEVKTMIDSGQISEVKWFEGEAK